MPSNISGNNSSSPTSHSSTPTDASAPDFFGKKILIKGSRSFKVLSECPIILVLLFQIYKKFINLNIPSLVPLIITVSVSHILCGRIFVLICTDVDNQ